MVASLFSCSSVPVVSSSAANPQFEESADSSSSEGSAEDYESDSQSECDCSDCVAQREEDEGESECESSEEEQDEDEEDEDSPQFSPGPEPDADADADGSEEEQSVIKLERIEQDEFELSEESSPVFRRGTPVTRDTNEQSNARAMLTIYLMLNCFPISSVSDA